MRLGRQEVRMSKEFECHVCSAPVDCFEICGRCGWQHEPLRCLDDDGYSSINHANLHETKKRWTKCPVCECGYDNAHPCKMCGFGWADNIEKKRAEWKAKAIHLELDPKTGMRFWR